MTHEPGTNHDINIFLRFLEVIGRLLQIARARSLGGFDYLAVLTMGTISTSHINGIADTCRRYIAELSIKLKNTVSQLGESGAGEVHSVRTRYNEHRHFHSGRKH